MTHVRRKPASKLNMVSPQFSRPSLSLNELLRKNQRGRRPVFIPGPFLPLALVRERGLNFNAVLRDPAAMTEVALMSYELGVESTVLPFEGI
jgi:hypothetical protein